MSFRVCIACYGIRVYPYMGFMVGQQFECQDCQERMVVPLEFDNGTITEPFGTNTGRQKHAEE